MFFHSDLITEGHLYSVLFRFKSSVLSLASHIHAHFIKENAPSQINLHEQVKIKVTFQAIFFSNVSPTV